MTYRNKRLELINRLIQLTDEQYEFLCIEDMASLEDVLARKQEVMNAYDACDKRQVLSEAEKEGFAVLMEKDQRNRELADRLLDRYRRELKDVNRQKDVLRYEGYQQISTGSFIDSRK